MTTTPPSLPPSDPSATDPPSDPSETNRALGTHPGEPIGDGVANEVTAPPVYTTHDDTPQAQLDGSIETGDGTSGAKKRRKRPGWKGWALVVEDAEGNVLEYRPRGESPEAGKEEEASRGEQSNTMSC